MAILAVSSVSSVVTIYAIPAILAIQTILTVRAIRTRCTHRTIQYDTHTVAVTHNLETATIRERFHFTTGFHPCGIFREKRSPVAIHTDTRYPIALHKEHITVIFARTLGKVLVGGDYTHATLIHVFDGIAASREEKQQAKQ
jgi:hypothetical protein